MLQKNKGILLKATKYSEADLIVQILTAQGERITLIAKGALKSKKRFGGGILQPSHYIEFTYRKSTSSLWIIQEAHLINGFDKLRTEFDRLDTAFFLLDIILKISQEGDAFGVGLFDLLGNGLKALETTESYDHLKLHFGLKVLNQQGVLDPEIWMRPFLTLPLSEHQKTLQIEKTNIRQQLIWLENRLREYMTTGSL